MTNYISPNYQFSKLKNLQVEANFLGGEVSSDGGALLLREAEKKLGLISEISKCFKDTRDQGKIKHDKYDILKQRVYGVALGYEDLNDHKQLRKCSSLQTTVGGTEVLASAPTLCRFENKVDREFAVSAHKIMVEQFIKSFKEAPKKLILDFDATDAEIHGNQEGKFFNGYYGHYCFLPLYVFCNKKLLVSYLRTSKVDQAKHSLAILSLLVKRLRQEWPEAEIIFRGDSGFCRQKMLNWCDRNNVKYIVGIPKNNRLLELLKPTMQQANDNFETIGQTQRLFSSFQYSAQSWSCERKIVGKAEVTAQGENPRFIVTNLEGGAEELYDEIYCARGDMENRIKEQQLELFADRTSCSDWWPNQFRLLLSGLAYILIEYIRDNLLQGTELAKAQVGTIRLKLFKIGAVIIRNTRRIKFLLSSSYPYQHVWNHVLKKLALE